MHTCDAGAVRYRCRKTTGTAINCTVGFVLREHGTCCGNLRMLPLFIFSTFCSQGSELQIKGDVMIDDCGLSNLTGVCEKIETSDSRPWASHNDKYPITFCLQVSKYANNSIIFIFDLSCLLLGHITCLHS